MRRAVLIPLVVLALVIGTRADAGAGEQWCETDPLVVVTTPGGAAVALYVTNGAAGVEQLAAVQLADISYTTLTTDGGSATLVHMTVTVPTGLDGSPYDTSSVVSTGPLKTGVILASVRGSSGLPMRMDFK